jgi:Suppressor of fused protein (SUFU)
MSLDKHKALTAVRARAYGELFGCTPSAVYPPHALFKKPDERFLIDILVYTLETGSGNIDVAVTSGMSDQLLADPGHPHEWERRELIQYLPKCTEGHARRLHDMAWLPLFDGFYLDSHHTVAWPHAAVAGTPWNNAFFLLPLIRSHREFVFEVEGDPVSFLWHVPISDEERAYKQQHGADALIDRMDAVGLPWVFDENNRPSLVEEKDNGIR